jgi:sulfatase modifying factor 1
LMASEPADVTVERSAGDTLTNPRLGTLRYIPAGSFTMGCVSPRDVAGGLTSCSQSSELPTRTVTLTTAFEMMESELTQGMWSALGFTNPSFFSGSTKPVETVNWWEALEAANEASRRDGLPVCYTLTGCSGTMGSDFACTGVTVTSSSGHPKDCDGWRLPTEAEWEYAARAGTSFPFSGGSAVSQVAWHSGNNSPSGTKAVCTTPTPRNAWGLCDMSGNVWEWTWDRYVSSYSGAATTDPTGPASGSSRVFRGGRWFDSAQFVRVAFRNYDSPGFRLNGLGFRLVRSVP